MVELYNAKQLRVKIKELTDELHTEIRNKNWGKCDILDLYIEDLTRELQLKERSSYYSIEK